VLLALWLDKLHTKWQVCISSFLIYELFHGQSDKYILVVDSNCILGVLISQQDAYFALSDLASLKAPISNWITINVADVVFVPRMWQEDSHFMSWIVRLKDDSMPILWTMVNVEQLLAKVIQRLYHHLPRDNQVRNFRWVGVIFSPSEVTFKTH